MIKITTSIPFEDSIKMFEMFFDEILLTYNDKKEAYILTNNKQISETILSSPNNDFVVDYNADLIMEKQKIKHQILGILPDDLF